MLNWTQAFGQMVARRQAIRTRVMKHQNAPDGVKRLRDFSQAEAAQMLGLQQDDFARAVATGGLPEGTKIGIGRRAYSFEDIQAMRTVLFERTKDNRFAPMRRAGEKIAVCAVANYKGGTCKTTTAVHLALSFARRGFRTLLIDLDAQASATAKFGINPERDVPNEGTIAGWIAADALRQTSDVEAKAKVARACIRHTHWPTLDIVPANDALQTAESAIHARVNRARELIEQAKQGKNVDIAELSYVAEREIPAFIGEIENDYDIVVLDCPPAIHELTASAIRAATGLIVPVQLSETDIESMEKFQRFVERNGETMRSTLGPYSWDFTAILPARVVATSGPQKAQLKFLKASHADMVLDAHLVDSSAVGNAYNVLETLYEYSPASDRKSYERAIASFEGIGKSIAKRIYTSWGRKEAPPFDAVPLAKNATERAA